MSSIPESFKKRIIAQFHPDGEAFLSAIDKPANTSIRVNKSKGNVQFDLAQNVLWCKDGLVLNSRPSFTLDPMFHAGCYYPQESSSMFLDFVLNHILETKSNVRFLDLCAAPGGKSLILSDFVGDNGVLISNEVNRSRNQILKEVITKWGRGNTIVTCNESKDFQNIKNYFDCVLVDAPCSGEGMFRKDMQARDEWSEENVAHCAIRQETIINDIADSVKENGYLIYSTCTFATEENEDNCQKILKLGFESVDISINEEWGIQKRISDGVIAFRFLPHLVPGEGFFIAAFKKVSESASKKSKLSRTFVSASKDESVILQNRFGRNFQIVKAPSGACFFSPVDLDELNLLAEHLYIAMPGIETGHFIRNDFIPAHPFALAQGKLQGYDYHELSPDQALNYLRGEQLNIVGKTGWSIVTYKGLSLGWVKILSNRVNNYYPKEWRIKLK